MKINWSKALADYLKDETQSYASIAKKYGVSKQSVVKRAVKEDWQSLRHKTLLEVDQKLTEIVGEDIAIVNAKHAQMGRLLQAIALKAIKEGDLKPENFMQALRSITEGVKIERETLVIREVVKEDRPIFNTPEMARECAIKVPISQKPPPLSVASVNKPPEQTPPKPIIDPKMLERIQEQLLQIQRKTDELQKKWVAEQAKIESSNPLSGWH